MEKILSKIVPVNSWRITNTFLMARKMEKNKLAAARIRCRYLYGLIEMCRKADHPIATFWADGYEQEVKELLKEAEYEIKEQPANRDIISDDDILSARAYPVEGMVEWRGGKSRAWCHEDKTPSLFYGSRVKRIVCPVCNNRKFNAVDVLMTRDGYTFVDAVKALR